MVLRGGCYDRCCSIFCSNTGFGYAPTNVSTWRPSLKNRILGIERTLKRIAVRWLASTSTLATFSLPWYCPASCSRMGATMWHGPPHVAKKSTLGTPACSSPSPPNVASVPAPRCISALPPPPFYPNLYVDGLHDGPVPPPRTCRHRGPEHRRRP